MSEHKENIPLCICGCGQKVNWDAKRKRFSKKINGHTVLSLNVFIERMAIRF